MCTYQILAEAVVKEMTGVCRRGRILTMDQNNKMEDVSEIVLFGAGL